MTAQAVQHRGTWNPAEHDLAAPYVPAAADMPETAHDLGDMATRAWFVAATSMAAVFVATAGVFLIVAVLR